MPIPSRPMSAYYTTVSHPARLHAPVCLSRGSVCLPLDSWYTPPSPSIAQPRPFNPPPSHKRTWRWPRASSPRSCPWRTPPWPRSTGSSSRRNPTCFTHAPPVSQRNVNTKSVQILKEPSLVMKRAAYMCLAGCESTWVTGKGAHLRASFTAVSPPSTPVVPGSTPAIINQSRQAHSFPTEKEPKLPSPTPQPPPSTYRCSWAAHGRSRSTR